MKKLSIIIPAFNENATIRLVVERIQAVNFPLDYEIIIIDDASYDRTFDQVVLLRARARRKFGIRKIRLFKNRKNYGKGYSIRQGIQRARGDIIVIQDADSEYAPREIPKLLEPILRGEADAVYGSRFLGKKKPAGMAFANWVANRFLTGLTNRMYGTRLTDMETCYKVMKASLVKPINLRSNRFTFEPEITAELAKRNARIVELPIDYVGRNTEQGKKIKAKDFFYAIFALFRCRFLATSQSAGDITHSSTAIKPPLDSVLQCPVCRSFEPTLIKEISENFQPRMSCQNCLSSFLQEEDFFYRLAGKGSISQERSLLLHQEEFGCEEHLHPVFGSLSFDVAWNMLKEGIQKIRPGLILDLGCGNGAYGTRMTSEMDFFTKYIGLEPSRIPENIRLKAAPSDRVTLVHYDPEKPLPVHDQSMDLVLLCASYDHIPDPERVVPELWEKLRAGGGLLILMTNYGFWLKRLVNVVLKGSYFKHEHDHYRVHTPDTLIAEIHSFIAGSRILYKSADTLFLPTLLPPWDRFYFSKKPALALNAFLKFLICRILRHRDHGSVMCVLFVKESPLNELQKGSDAKRVLNPFES